MVELKLRVLKKEKDLLEVEIEGARHTLPNLIRSELWNDDSVTLAAYSKDHPYLGNPRLIVKAKDPKKSLAEAIKRLSEDFKKFEKEFSRAAK